MKIYSLLYQWSLHDRLGKFDNGMHGTQCDDSFVSLIREIRKLGDSKQRIRGDKYGK